MVVISEASNDNVFWSDTVFLLVKSMKTLNISKLGYDTVMFSNVFDEEPPPPEPPPSPVLRVPILAPGTLGERYGAARDPHALSLAAASRSSSRPHSSRAARTRETGTRAPEPSAH